MYPSHTADVSTFPISSSQSSLRRGHDMRSVKTNVPNPVNINESDEDFLFFGSMNEINRNFAYAECKYTIPEYIADYQTYKWPYAATYPRLYNWP